MDRFLLASLFVLAAAGAAGCTPQIGDHCALNTDCSITGTLFCDTSQPNGYCTYFNCSPNSCQNNAICVLLQGNVPGCPYDDYQSPSRTGNTMCLKPCTVDSDCRQGEGYHCADPTKPPYNAQILDSNQGGKVCLVNVDYDAGPVASYGPDAAAVCQVSNPNPPPPIEAGVNLLDAGVPTDAGGPGGDAATEAGGEAGPVADAGAPDANEAGADAGADAASDATLGADAADAGAAAGNDATVDATGSE